MLFLLILHASTPTCMAVTEIAPDPFNKGNWNREELLDHLKRSWDEGDMGVMSTWFNAEAEWKPIWVKITFWRQPDSDFKRQVVLMMLRGEPAAWGDPPPGKFGIGLEASPERGSTIAGCLEVIRSAAPGLAVTESDFESARSRLIVAEKFEAAIRPKEPIASEQRNESSGDGTQATPTEEARKTYLGLPLEWVLILGGVVVGSIYVMRKGRI